MGLKIRLAELGFVPPSKTFPAPQAGFREGRPYSTTKRLAMPVYSTLPPDGVGAGLTPLAST